MTIDMHDVRQTPPEDGENVEPKEDKADTPPEEEEYTPNPEPVPAEPEKPEDKEPENKGEESPEDEEEPEPKPDYEEKFKYSSRQNQVVRDQYRRALEQLEDITKDEIPSDEEMLRMYPNYTDMDDQQQTVLKASVVSQRTMRKVHKALSDANTQLEDIDTLQRVVNNDPRLKGKEDAFIEYALKPSNKGADPAVLASAFLFDNLDNEPSPEKPKKKGRPTLERGGRGPEDTSSHSEEYTPEQLDEMRKSQPKKYNELIRKGKI